MNYSMQETRTEVVLLPSSRPCGTVVWLHGLGADGHDFVPIVSALDLPAHVPLKFVFPHATERAVTVNGGYRMRAWYDIAGLSADAVEDASGIAESQRRVNEYIAAEQAQGTPAGQIVLAGFSQGAAIAMHTALRFPARLAGLVGLSGYLLRRDTLALEGSHANKGVPFFMAHGLYDAKVPFALAELSRRTLEQQGYAIEWHTYPMAHEVSPQEVADIAAWLQKIYA